MSSTGRVSLGHGLASVVAEPNAVVGVALEAADDDDDIFLTIIGTLVCQRGPSCV